MREKKIMPFLIVSMAGIGLAAGGWLVAGNTHERRIFLCLVLSGALLAWLALLPVRRKVSPAKHHKSLAWPAAVGAGMGMPLISALSSAFHIPKSLLYASLFGFCAGLCIAVCSLPFYLPLAGRLVSRVRGSQQGARVDGP